MKTVFLFGGSGYIGTAITESLMEKNVNIINIDKNTPNDKLFDYRNSYTYIHHDLANGSTSELINKLNKIMDSYELVGAIHLAAYKSLPESISNPYVYYWNNVISILTAVEVFNKYRTSSSKFLFSSSAAIYDINESDGNLLTEGHRISFNNPYGNTKLFGEIMLNDLSNQYNFNSLSLRYFNPIGSTKLSVDTSESMFSNIRRALKSGSVFEVFGDDYDTRDGSCIRDFIDIRDLAEAHIYFLTTDQVSLYDVINIGTGTGTTVLEVVETVRTLYPNFRYKVVGRRIGDLPGVVADNSKMISYGFRTSRNLIDSISSLKLY